MRQIWAVYYIFREHTTELLSTGRTKDAHLGMNRLSNFLLKDPKGFKSHIETPVDFLEVLKELRSCPAMHLEYKNKTLAQMIARIEDKRLRLGRRLRSNNA